MALLSRNGSSLLTFCLAAGLAMAPVRAQAGLWKSSQKTAQASGTPQKKSIGRYIRIGALALAIGLPGMVGVSSYNHIVREQQQVASSFSSIDVELQRRADLIPNLVSVVKGYAKHEQETFVKVAQARSALMSASTVDQKIAASQQLSMTLMPVIALQEKYPDLKANENFRSLMRSLETTENRISVERSRYNDAAAAFNTTIKTFPRSTIAKMGSFKEAPYFKADSAALHSVDIDLTH